MAEPPGTTAKRTQHATLRKRTLPSSPCASASHRGCRTCAPPPAAESGQGGASGEGQSPGDMDHHDDDVQHNDDEDNDDDDNDDDHEKRQQRARQ